MITFDTTRGKGGKVEAWTQPTPWGEMATLAATDRGLAFLGFGDQEKQVHERFGAQNVLWIKRLIDLYAVDRIHIWGTPFQEAVWRALLDIPKGETRTYAWVAQQIGRPKALRAVGTAVGANPLSVVVPCHRVVRSDGTLGNYAWGKPLKQKIVDWEQL